MFVKVYLIPSPVIPFHGCDSDGCPGAEFGIGYDAVDYGVLVVGW